MENNELAKRRKEIKETAKKFVGEPLYNANYGKVINISSTSIKEWLNQPHEYIEEKNELLLNIKEIIEKSKYYGFLPDIHNTSIKAHIFEIDVKNIKSWIIVREFADGTSILHSITDSPVMKELIIKMS